MSADRRVVGAVDQAALDMESADMVTVTLPRARWATIEHGLSCQVDAWRARGVMLSALRLDSARRFLISQLSRQ